MLEIELKVQVPDLVPVRERLLAIGAHMTEKTGEHDIYYNAPHRDFAVTDEALRSGTAAAGPRSPIKVPSEGTWHSKPAKN